MVVGPRFIEDTCPPDRVPGLAPAMLPQYVHLPMSFASRVLYGRPLTSRDKGYAGGHKGPHTTPHHPRPYGLMSTFPRNLPRRDPTLPIRDIEHRGQVLLQEGAILLVWNKFDSLGW